MQRIRKVLGTLGGKKKKTKNETTDTLGDSSPKSTSFIDQRPTPNSYIFIPAKPTPSATDTLSTSDKFTPLSQRTPKEGIYGEKEQSSQEDLREKEENTSIDPVSQSLQEKLSDIINKLRHIPEVEDCRKQLTNNMHLKKSNPVEYIKKCQPAISKYQSTEAPEIFMHFEQLVENYEEKYNQSSNLNQAVQELINIKKLIENTDHWIINCSAKENLEKIRDQITSFNRSDLNKIKEDILIADLSISDFQSLLSDLAKKINEAGKNIRMCIKVFFSQLKSSNGDLYIKECEDALNQYNRATTSHIISLFDSIFELYIKKYSEFTFKKNDGITLTHQAIEETAQLLTNFKKEKLNYDNWKDQYDTSGQSFKFRV